ncbi:MAG: GNAT family N-acetyltransferase [Candidatus Saccharimonadales bacterium]
MQVRLYQGSDFEKLIALYKNKASYGGNYDENRDTPSKLEETARVGSLYVAEDSSGCIVGSFMILDNPHTFWLIRFVLDPEAEDLLAIGGSLAKKAQEVAQERGHSSIIVYTDSDDQSLNQRYTDLGFNKADEYRCYWKGVA